VTFFDLHLLAEDRKAIMDMEHALRTWNHYMIATRRRDAEIICAVRKGRLVDVPTGTAGGAGAEIGPADDLLYVYIAKPDGSLQGPVWKHYLRDGLGTPDIPFSNNSMKRSKLPQSRVSPPLPRSPRV
jgi:hypothetical protein